MSNISRRFFIGAGATALLGSVQSMQLFYFLIPVDPHRHHLGYIHTIEGHSSKTLKSFSESA